MRIHRILVMGWLTTLSNLAWAAPDFARIVQPLASMPAPPAEIEKTFLDAFELDCNSVRPVDALECMIEITRGTCTKRYPSQLEACMSWGNHFAALILNKKNILQPTDRERLRLAQGAERSLVLKELLRMRARRFEEIFELSAENCAGSNPECESRRIEKFCQYYSIFKKIPMAACAIQVLHGKISRKSP